jgi:hypothetical protein
LKALLFPNISTVHDLSTAAPTSSRRFHSLAHTFDKSYFRGTLVRWCREKGKFGFHSGSWRSDLPPKEPIGWMSARFPARQREGSIEAERHVLFGPLDGDIDAAGDRLTSKVCRMATFCYRLNNRGGKKRKGYQTPDEAFIH